MIPADEVLTRCIAIRRHLDDTGGADVQMLAVTKGFGPEAIVAAIAAGCTVIGESYSQELLAKRQAITDGCEVQFIGRLQSNKVRQLASIVDVFASVDRPSLVAEIARRAPRAHILVQVDPAAAQGKGGCPPGEVEALVTAAVEAGLVVDGLMTVGPTSGTAEDARAGFRTVRALTTDLGLEVCSMGMSGDMDVAVQEGSTQVRLGSALFGPRS